MTEEEQKTLDGVKREAAVSLIKVLARAMGARVLYYNPEVGEVTLKMDPLAIEFFGRVDLRQALGDVS